MNHPGKLPLRAGVSLGENLHEARTRPRSLSLPIALLVFGLCPVAAEAQNHPHAGPTPQVREAAQSDTVTRLLEHISAGKVTLHGSDLEILQTVLRELEVPVESQVVVFSRTSLQAGLIRPDNPRALYFSDSTYVGWMPGGLIEVAAIDPRQGPIFYAFDPQDARDRRRTFVRETSCLRCHGGGNTEHQLFARSVYSTDAGEPLRQHASVLVTERSPFEERWGGWYVTGYDGKQHHRGNAFGRDREARLEFKPSDRRPVELSTFFDTTKYLAGTSDVVALLVFEHQMAVQNSLLAAERKTRGAIRTLLARDVSPVALAEAEQQLSAATRDVLDHLLFRDAAPLPEGVGGSPAFARAFTGHAPRSRRGDSLKDFSLRDRLFANRCSFQIHSAQFSALPSPLRDRILDQLHAALREDAGGGRYAYLEKEEKRRILGILSETHADFQLRVRQQRVSTKP